MKEEIDFDDYMKTFTEEYEKIKDFRLQVLFLHLHIEYWINKIIAKNFHKPDLILKNIQLKSFFKKLNILESLNIIGGEQLKNMYVVNSIRNHYSHNIVHKGEIPKKVIRHIDKLYGTLWVVKGGKIPKTHIVIGSSINIILYLHHTYETIKDNKRKEKKHNVSIAFFLRKLLKQPFKGGS